MSNILNDTSTIMNEAGWGGGGSDPNDFRHIADKKGRDKAKQRAMARSAKLRRWQAVRESTFSEADYAEEEARLAREVQEMMEARRHAA